MNIPQKPGIYLLTNKINRKIYVGKSVNMYQRVRKHKASEKLNEHDNCYITNAIKKYGWDNFEASVLEQFEEINNEELLKIESQWIIKLNSTDRSIGYNILVYSNDCTGIKRSEQTRQKLSKIAKERFLKQKGTFSGKHHTEETKKILSEKRKGKPPWNKNIFGNKLSEETKQKMRDAHIGRVYPKQTEEAKKNMKAASIKRAANIKRDPVRQIDPKTGNTIKVWNSALEACLALGFKRNNSTSILMVCKKQMKNGFIKQTAIGFKWEFAQS